MYVLDTSVKLHCLISYLNFLHPFFCSFCLTFKITSVKHFANWNSTNWKILQKQQKVDKIVSSAIYLKVLCPTITHRNVSYFFPLFFWVWLLWCFTEGKLTIVICYSTMLSNLPHASVFWHFPLIFKD